MNNRTYIIINSAILNAVPFNSVLETSTDTVRKNNDGSLVVLKYEGQVEPGPLNGLSKVSVNGRLSHNQEQILEIMATTGPTGWSQIEEI